MLKDVLIILLAITSIASTVAAVNFQTKLHQAEKDKALLIKATEINTKTIKECKNIGYLCIETITTLQENLKQCKKSGDFTHISLKEGSSNSWSE